MKWRVVTVAALLALALGLLALKSGRLQLVLGDELRELAERQYLRDLKIEAPRGAVLDRDGRPLAVSVAASSIFAAPRDIDDPAAVASRLAPILQLDEAQLTKRLTGERAFVWLKRRVDPQTASAVDELGLEGIAKRSEPRRYYPEKTVAGQLLGTVSIDGVGQSGIERQYDAYLRGRSTTARGLRDNHGRRILMSGGLDVTLMAGDDVQLTLDVELQHLAERLLQDALVRYRAKSAFAVVIDPKTGAVRAMANAPLFNPNAPNQGAKSARRNHVLSDAFEPGSTMKILTFAAALEAGVVTPDERIFCENGRIKIGRHTIRDLHPAGWLSAREVFSHSSNIGTIKIAQRVGQPRMQAFLEDVGFGQRPGTGLVGESKGRLPSRWGDVRLATVAFGHGLLVTPLQMGAAVAAVANGGVYQAPYLLENVRTASGDVVARGEPSAGRRVMSEETAKTLTEIMKGVVAVGGTGRRATIRGVPVAGKTGTAEKVDPVTGRYSRELNIASFVGFAPADDPEVVAVVMIDEPHGSVFGGSTAGPIWRELVEAALIDAGTLDAGDSDAPEVSAVVPTSPARADTLIESPGDAPITSEPGVVPDLKGLSLRRALVVAQAAGLRVRAAGRGRVVAQSQQVGNAFSEVDGSGIIELTLELESP